MCIRDRFSIQHEKSWLVDDEILLFGSHNGTANSLLNCEENLGAVCDAGVVARASAHFEEVWAVSRPVDESDTRLAAAKVRARARSQEDPLEDRGEGAYQLPPPRPCQRGRSLTLKGTEFYDVASRSRSASLKAQGRPASDDRGRTFRPEAAQKVQPDIAARMQRLLKSGVLEDIANASSGPAARTRPGCADGDAQSAAGRGLSTSSRGTASSAAGLGAGLATSGHRGLP